jgi:hypothetical protein
MIRSSLADKTEFLKYDIAHRVDNDASKKTPQKDQTDLEVL